MKVLQKERAVLPDSLRCFGVHDWAAIGSGIYRLLIVPKRTDRSVFCAHVDGMIDFVYGINMTAELLLCVTGIEDVPEVEKENSG